MESNEELLARIGRDATITRLKKLCMENYENGGDTPIECWDQKHWEEFVTEHGNQSEQFLRTLWSIWDERYQAAQDF